MEQIWATCTSPMMQVICPPQILYNLCFSFPLGIAAVPREIETMLIQNFGGPIMCIMGDVQVAYTVS